MKAQLLNAFEIQGLNSILGKDFAPVEKYGATGDDNLLNVCHDVKELPEEAQKIQARILRGVGLSRGGYVIFNFQSKAGDSLYYAVQDYEVVNYEPGCWDWTPLKFLKGETEKGGDFETNGEIEDTYPVDFGMDEEENED